MPVPRFLSKPPLCPGYDLQGHSRITHYMQHPQRIFALYKDHITHEKRSSKSIIKVGNFREMFVIWRDIVRVLCTLYYANHVNVDRQSWQFQADVRHKKGYSQSPLYTVPHQTSLAAIAPYDHGVLEMCAECRSTRPLLLGRLTTLSVPVRHRITKHLLRLSISNTRVSPSSRAFH